MAGASDGAAPAWVWVDIGIAWALAPVIGGSLQLGLWVAMVPSWLCVTLTVGYEIRAEEVSVLYTLGCDAVVRYHASHDQLARRGDDRERKINRAN